LANTPLSLIALQSTAGQWINLGHQFQLPTLSAPQASPARAVLGLLNFVGKYVCQAINRLALPRGDLGEMNSVFRCNLLRSFVTAQRSQTTPVIKYIEDREDENLGEWDVVFAGSSKKSASAPDQLCINLKLQ
jgi:hypothetical protein